MIDWTQDGTEGFDEKVCRAAGFALELSHDLNDVDWRFFRHKSQIVERFESQHNPKYAQQPAPKPIVCEFCGDHCYGGAEHNARVEDNARWDDPQPVPASPAPVEAGDGFEEWWKSSCYANPIVPWKDDAHRISSLASLAWSAALAHARKQNGGGK